MKPGDLVRVTSFADLHEIHPREMEHNYNPRDVFQGDLGILLEVDVNQPLWGESITYKQPGLAWVKWCVRGMVGWSDPYRMEVIS